MPVSGSESEITEAIDLLASGGVVVLPTDTLYGLGANVFDEAALRRVYAIKGRPVDTALPVLVAGWQQLKMVAEDTPQLAAALAQRFWPGPLTLVLRKTSQVSTLVTGGRQTVAVRMPDHPVPLVLTGRLGRPITGTSANRSGEPDLVSMEDVELNLGGLVDQIIRCGPSPKGIQSTIVDVTSGAPTLLREGAIPFEEILLECG